MTIFIGLLKFHIRGSQEKCPSFACGSIPGAEVILLDWIMCCNPNSEIDSDHVTFHRLTDLDKNLSTILAQYSKSNIVGLIIINTTNSISLSDDFTNQEADAPLIPPIYVVSSEDGEELEKFISVRDEGSISIKVVFESGEDFVPVEHAGPSHHTPPSL